MAEIAASSQMNSATRSRAVSHGASGRASPSRPANASQQVQGAVAPEFHRAERAAELADLQPRRGPAARRSRCRSSSAAHTAALKPNVIGRPGWPWVRPHIGVSAVLGGQAERAVPHPAHVALGDDAEVPEDQGEPGVGQSCTVAP